MIFFNDRRNKPVESKRVGKLRSMVTGEQVGSYTAPKNTHIDMPMPSDYKTAEYHRKRGNTFQGQIPGGNYKKY